MMPDVLLSEDKSGAIPRGGRDLGDGYVLLRACQPTAIDISEPEATAIMKLWDAKGWLAGLEQYGDGHISNFLMGKLCIHIGWNLDHCGNSEGLQ